MKEATWAFKVVHANPEYRSYLFSASSEKEMGQWMKLFKTEMLRASGKLNRLVLTIARGSGAVPFMQSYSLACAARLLLFVYFNFFLICSRASLVAYITVQLNW
jgi:hypothetical protein